MTTDPDHLASVMVELKEAIQHHVREEESEILPQARTEMSGAALAELAVQFEATKREVARARLTCSGRGGAGRGGPSGADTKSRACLRFDSTVPREILPRECAPLPSISRLEPAAAALRTDEGLCEVRDAHLAGTRGRTNDGAGCCLFE